jgi:hypothetical protein
MNMQLNKTHKAKIVLDIMADIPQIDHTAQAHALLQAKAIEKMPAEVRAVYDKPELRRWLAVRFATHANHIGGSYIVWQREGELGHGTSLYAYRIHYNDSTEDRELVREVQGPLADLSRAAEDQWKARRSMEDKLKTVLAGIRTLKQAKTLLEPELHKYLPVEPPKDDAQKAAQASTALVPYVVANLREMGWPKEDQKSTEGSN